MADVIRQTADHVVVGIRFPRRDFEHMVAGYPSRGQALRALRVLVFEALAVASMDGARDSILGRECFTRIE